MWYYVARPTQRSNDVIVVGHYPDWESAVQAAAGGILPFHIVAAATDREARVCARIVCGLGPAA
jgi:hypothetical protein